MNKLISLIRRAPKRFSAIVLIAAAAIIIPVAVSAWGPDRPTFTAKNPATYPVFNSMTDNPKVGDERNFVRVRESGAGTYNNQVTFQPGKVYEVSVYYHNNAASNLNESGVGIAKNAKLKMEVPNIVKSGVNAALTGTISASNTTPKSVWDEAYGKNATNGDIALRYVSGSAAFTSFGAINGQKVPDSLFTTGANLGYNSQNGEVPGCNEFSGYVTFKLRVDQPNFNVIKKVSVDSGKTWADSAKAKAGASVQYYISYQNTGTNQQDNVTVRDILPKGVTYTANSTYIMNSTTGGEFKKTVEGIAGSNGLNAGSYQPKGNVGYKFSAKLPAASALECGSSKLVNTARVTTNSGYKEDTATVTIDKDCPPEVKKIQVCELATYKIVTINEKDFDAKKYSKNLEDCKKIIVCELSTNKIIVIRATEFDAKKYSRDIEDCKTAPNKINVCEIATKKIVTIDEKDFDASKYSKDLSVCAEVPPVTPPVTPETPTELPQTGAGDIAAIVGLGALIASSVYYVASRRALGL